MKKAFSILMLCVFFFGCNIKEKPEFIGVENIGITKASLDTINLKANAIFKNGIAIGYFIEVSDHVQAAIYQDGAWIDLFTDIDMNVLKAVDESA